MNSAINTLLPAQTAALQKHCVKNRPHVLFGSALACLLIVFPLSTAASEDEEKGVPIQQEQAPPVIEIRGGQEIQLQGGGKIQVQGAGVLRIQGNVQVEGNAPANANEAAANPSWLGVQLENNLRVLDIDEDENEKPPPGAGILSVIDGAPAQKAGMKAMDRVLKIDGKALKDENELRTIVRATKPGTTIKVLVLRDEKEIELKIVLEKMPAEQNLGLFQGFGNRPRADRVQFYNTPRRTSDGPTNDSVTLCDGNRLEGKLTSLSATELTLKMDFGPNVVLDATKIATLRIGSANKPRTLHNAVMLQTGDWLAVQKVLFEKGKFSLTTEDGSTLELERPAVAEVTLASREIPVLYRGPRPADGWKSVPHGRWKFKDGIWSSNEDGGYLAKKFDDLPGALELSFAIPHPEQRSTRLSLFAQRPDGAGRFNASPGAISLDITQNSVSVVQFDGYTYQQIQPKPDSAIPQAPELLRDLNPNNPRTARFSVFCDRIKGELILLKNGVSLGTFPLVKMMPEDLNRAGRLIQFHGYENLTITEISLRPWIGNLPKQSPDLIASDWLSTDNQEGSSSDLVKISPNEITLGNGKTFPLSHAHHLRLKSPPKPNAPLPAPIWIETKQGSGVSAESLRLTDGKLIAQTSFHQGYTIPLESVMNIEYDRPREIVNPASREIKLDTLAFRSGRQLTGSFVPSIEGGILKWKISAAKQLLEFPVKEVGSILLVPPVEAVHPLESVVRFCNGDWLPAKIIRLDARTLTFKAPFGAALQVSRSAVQTVYSAPAATVISDAASGRKRWKESTGGTYYLNNSEDGTREGAPLTNYSYQDGSYTLRKRSTPSNGGDGIHLPIPPNRGAVTVEFSVTSTQNWLTFGLMDRKFNLAYNIFFSGNTMQVTGAGRMDRAKGARFMAGEQFSFKLPERLNIGSEFNHIQLVLDPDNHSIHLGIGGKKVGTCKMKKPESWIDIGSVCFMPQGNGNETYRISNVWTAPWQGTFEPPRPLNDKSVWLSFLNGDATSGSVLSLNSESVEIDTEAAGPLTVPLSRLRTLDLNPATAPAAPNYRIRLYDHGLISATDLRLQEKSISLTTQLGDISIPLDQIKEIVFVTPQ